LQNSYPYGGDGSSIAFATLEICIASDGKYIAQNRLEFGCSVENLKSTMEESTGFEIKKYQNYSGGLLLFYEKTADLKNLNFGEYIIQYYKNALAEKDIKQKETLDPWVKAYLLGAEANARVNFRFHIAVEQLSK